MKAILQYVLDLLSHLETAKQKAILTNPILLDRHVVNNNSAIF